MLQNKFISPFILFIIINTVMNNSNELDNNETQFVSQFYLKFQDGYYLFFYTLFWGILIDYSIYQVLYNKQSFDYINQHTVLNFIIISGQSYRLWFNFAFITIEFSVAVLELLQFLLGNRIQILKLEKHYTPSIEFYRKFHKILGMIIYIIHKLNLSFYTFMYFVQKSSLIAVFTTAQVIVLPILTHTWFHFVNKIYNTKIQIQKDEFLLDTHDKKKEDYKHLIQKIQNEQIDDNSNNKLSLTSNANQQLIEEDQQDKIKWVLIEDNLFDVTGYMHPLGRFILKQMQRQDITREYYGLKSCLFYNRKTKTKKFIKHCHSGKTNNFLEKRCITKIKFKTFIKEYDYQQRSDTVGSFKFDQIDQIEDKQQQYIWNIDLYYPEQDDKLVKIFQINDSSNNYIIDLKSFWPDYFGKYFLLNTEEQNQDWMYFSFSLSSAYIKMKIEWIASIKQNIELEIQQYLENSLQNSNQFFEFDKSQQEITHSKHICLLGNDENFQKLKNKKLQISKPLGGLCIESFSCRNYLIIAKDQSIYSLIDLIEFLACKTLIERSDMEIQHFIFNKDYLAYFYNQPKIYLYLEISKKFEKEAQYLLLNNLYLINKQYQLDTDKKISQVLRKVVICMNDIESDQILINTRKKKAKNFKEILQYLKITKSKKPDMVMLGGEDKFQQRVISKFNLQMNKLHFL